MTLNDEVLTHNGLEVQHGAGSVLILACGALANEILALIRVNGWDHMSLTCLPAILHNAPEKIPNAVREAVEKHRADFDQIFLAYADCGTGGQLETLCAEMGIEMIRGPHCYSFFEGNDTFTTRTDGEIDVFYLTDFLARGFENFVIKPLGLDRHPQLRDMYFGHYTKVMYLAQTNNPELDKLAEAAAERLGLAYERRFTGYGDLEAALRGQH
ncbi:Protein of unknown function [Aliiroseovarius halocynthiae]|uniref:DUF1638 domain-containing protein n=1 Tax=Aliiroseovarius halocynthiae TaxID=985055 RepID=A0A545SWI7_9RHOB|nr:DUF1638 domain-containing protein [Aliiroseovarius halocynthiae]TQV69325.1 DUF1638 domain-containing protein [Aliiroseovarius halocynthiae]SMR72105.1 Protein of unknown function [Aliiroseovarius halocynthiae]